jgi:hypothetical protein
MINSPFDWSQGSEWAMGIPTSWSPFGQKRTKTFKIGGSFNQFPYLTNNTPCEPGGVVTQM